MIKSAIDPFNPYALKDGYYINSMYYGMVPGDGFELISSTVVSGPYDTAELAEEEMQLQFGDEIWEYAISGPADKIGNIWGPWK